MIGFISQSPTVGPTPAAVVYNLPPPGRDREGQQLRSMFEAIHRNQVVQPDKVYPLLNTVNCIDALHDLSENWGGCDMAAPEPAAIEQAKRWIASMYRDAKLAGYPWMDPHVSAGEDGDVSFEWWNSQNKLTVYVSASGTLLLKVWGPNITSQMSEGVAETASERQAAWAWLLN